jgi:hypothetical protein
VPSLGSASDASTKPRSETTSGGDRRLNDPMTRFWIVLVSLGLAAGLLFSAVVDTERVRQKIRDVRRALGTRLARRRPSLNTPLIGSRSISPPAPDLADDLLRSTRGKGASVEGGRGSAAELIDSYSFRAESDVRRQPDSRAITDSAATIAPAPRGPAPTQSLGFGEAQPRKAGTAEAWLERELKAAAQEKSPVSLLLVRPNSIGTGDAKATSIAEVVNGIEQELADVSFALRREDDVVLVVLPATRSETAKRIAKRIELFLPRRTGDVGGRETAVTTAATEFPRDGTDADELIGSAREAIRRQAPSRSEHVSRGHGRES